MGRDSGTASGGLTPGEGNRIAQPWWFQGVVDLWAPKTNDEHLNFILSIPTQGRKHRVPYDLERILGSLRKVYKESY